MRGVLLVGVSLSERMVLRSNSNSNSKYRRAPSPLCGPQQTAASKALGYIFFFHGATAGRLYVYTYTRRWPNAKRMHCVSASRRI